MESGGACEGVRVEVDGLRYVDTEVEGWIR